MEDCLLHKAIVIIGGTSGIGLSAAKACWQQGASLCLVGKQENSPIDDPFFAQPEVQVQWADACLPDTAEVAIRYCHEHYGAFHGLYHVAGGSGRKWGDGPIHEMSMEAWEQTLQLNLSSVMLSNRAAIRYWKERGTGGTLLNLSSVLATSPSPEHFATHAYATAKAGIIGLSRSLASYYAASQIRVNVLLAGLIKTPMSQRAAGDEAIQQYIAAKQPLGATGMGMPENLDGLAVYFMSDWSKFTTGQCIAVDGGWSVSEA